MGILRVFSITSIITISSILAAFLQPPGGHTDERQNCDTVSFTQEIGKSRWVYWGYPVGHCINIKSILPTTITLNGDATFQQTCRHQIVTFKGSNCQDKQVINTQPLNLKRHPNAVLNPRKSTCSFKLHKPPSSKFPVTINFGFASCKRNLTYILDNNDCYDLCDSFDANSYPNWVGVYGRNGKFVNPRDNFVEIFSQRRCRESTKIRYENGASWIRQEPRLDILTRNSKQVVGSFKFIQ